MTPPADLEALLAEEARTAPGEPARSEALAHAEALRARHGEGVAAVLMYGSTLRDGAVEGRVLDFYVLADRTGPAYDRALPRLLARLDQPNVHFLPAGDGRHAPAKYALMTLDAFARRAGPAALSSYIWGRFAQPCWIVWSRDEAADRTVIAALARAARTMLAQAAPLLPDGASAQDIWIRAFAESYRAEPRSEPPGKAAELYAANAARYDRVAAAAMAEGLDAPAPEAARRQWRKRRSWGKTAAVLRIAKSSLTFEGGLDYAIWKIGRHSGTGVRPDGKTRVQKLAMLWRLVRARAIR